MSSILFVLKHKLDLLAVSLQLLNLVVEEFSTLVDLYAFGAVVLVGF